MNNVSLIGHVAVDSKVGNGVVSSLLAVKRIYKSRDGQDTDFIPLSIFGKQAENFSKMVSKGQQIGLDGRLKTSEYVDSDGSKKYGWTVAVDHFYLLNSSKHDSKPAASHDHNSQAKVDRQLDNLDKALDHAKEAQPKHKPMPMSKPMPVLSRNDPRLIARFDMSGDDKDNNNNNAHAASSDFNEKVVSSQPTVEQLEREIEELKSKALPF